MPQEEAGHQGCKQGVKAVTERQHLLVLPLALATHHGVHGLFQVVPQLGEELIHGFCQLTFCHPLAAITTAWG